jgi:tRNA G18 (ribose-2'-O)-methylase SpoU
LPEALSELRRQGFEIVGTDARSGRAIADHPFDDRSVVVLGNEREGLSDRVRLLCHGVIAIPGADTLDSLNVSVAAGIAAYELYRNRSDA